MKRDSTEPWQAEGGLYERWDYLKDAFAGWKAYWSKDLHSYFDGAWEKNPQVSAFQEWVPILWFVVAIAAILGVCWLVAASQPHYQIIPPVHPRVFPTFTTAPQ